MSLWISVSVAGIKLISLGGGAGGKRNGSGESDGKNLVRMRSILSLKKSRNVLARDGASGDSGSEFEGFRWRIVLRVFQSVRGIVGWFGYKIGQKWGFGFGNEGSDWVALSSEIHAVKGRLPATPTSLKSTTFTLGLENFGINPWCVGSLDNSLDLIGAWMSRMDLRVEESWSARSYNISYIWNLFLCSLIRD